MVQTAGYDDSILPQSTYRGAILTGWTGNEVLYAFNILAIWDSQDNKVISDKNWSGDIQKVEVAKEILVQKKTEVKPKLQLVKTHLKPEYIKKKKEAEEKRIRLLKARALKKLQNMEKNKEKHEQYEYERLNEESMMKGQNYVLDVKVEDKQRIRYGKRSSHKKEIKKKNWIASKNLQKRKREKGKNTYKLDI